MIDRKRCNYIDGVNARPLCRSIAVMANGFCNVHGGMGRKALTAYAKHKSKMSKQIQRIKSGLSIRGEDLDTAIARIEGDPYYRDLNYEVNTLAAMMEATQKELNNFGPKDPEYKMLYEHLIKMADVRSKAKERFSRISSSFVDIYTLKVVITQVAQMFTDLEKDFKIEFANDDKTLMGVLRIMGNHINQLDNVKVPLVREIK